MCILETRRTKRNIKRIDELRALARRVAGAIAVSPRSAEAVSTALQAYADQLSWPVEDHPNFTKKGCIPAP